MTDDIRIEPHEGWHKLVLNRPDRLNAVDAGMLTRLIGAIDAAEQDQSVRALLLTGEGRGFCAGQDLGPDVTPGPDGPPDLEALAGTYHHEVVRRIRASRLPVVCAVNGVAISFWPRNPRGSCRLSSRSAWCRIRAPVSF